MNLSHMTQELRELSGLSVEDFCQRIGVNVGELLAWESGNEDSGPGIGKLIKAVGVALRSRKDMDKIDRIDNRLCQAKAIVVTVMDSPELTEDQRLTLSVATELVDTARHDVLDN